MEARIRLETSDGGTVVVEGSVTSDESIESVATAKEGDCNSDKGSLYGLSLKLEGKCWVVVVFGHIVTQTSAKTQNLVHNLLLC